MAKPRFWFKCNTYCLAVLVAALIFAPSRGPEAVWALALVWFLAALAADSLWHRAVDGVTPITMAPAVYIAALTLLPLSWGVPVVAAAAATGSLLWRRDAPGQALVQGGVAGLASLPALGALLLAGAVGRAGAAPAASFFSHTGTFLAIAGAGVVFLAAHQGGVALAASRRRPGSPGRVWLETFGRETELVTSGALITVAILAAFCFDLLGYRGLLLCVMPLLFVRDGSLRNLELEKAQGLLIKNERLAAKGEMAAEIGHEINNYLAAVSGRAQLLVRKLGPEENPALLDEAERVRTLAVEMGELAKGLMDFSHREVKRTAFGINELVEKTVDFVRPQTRFRTWDFQLEPDPEVPRVQIDPGQIQQVLLVLLGRMAEGGKTDGEHRMRIRTFSDAGRKSVGIEIRSGIRRPPAEDGMPDEATLDTVRRIVDRHQGRFVVEDEASGEGYQVLLPAA